MYKPTHIATTNPTVNDDYSAGFRAGNYWWNRSTENNFILENDTTGAASWVLTTGGSAGAWDDWTPTFTFTGGSPTAPATYTARYIQVYDKINFYIDVEGTNDSGNTLTMISATPPVAITDVDAFIPCAAAVDENGKVSPSKTVLGFVDADTNLKIYILGLSITNGNDYRAVISGFYEVT